MMLRKYSSIGSCRRRSINVSTRQTQTSSTSSTPSNRSLPLHQYRTMSTPTTYSGYLDPTYLRNRFGNSPDSSTSNPSSIASSSSSSSSSDSDSESEGELERRAQLEWDESMRQLQLLVDVVLLPYVGKWAGRKWAYWAWGRYKDVGFGRAFFGGIFAAEAAVKTVEVLKS